MVCVSVKKPKNAIVENLIFILLILDIKYYETVYPVNTWTRDPQNNSAQFIASNCILCEIYF